MTSAVVMMRVLFLLENGKTIAVYNVEEPGKDAKGSYVKENNRMSEIHLQDMGLATDCELQKIWAGEDGSKSFLHVLYMHTGHGNMLASYTVDQTFLENCKLRV